MSSNLIPLFMEYGAGYCTPSGVRFSREHPYQLVPEEEATALLTWDKFRVATKEEVKSYYNLV